ncbi:hypothetical protein QE152_g29544 [Popillia japonica]|uniref:Uncharacterized protein n=1 Tax=Popillia japonica TaxID=7064 RepID=A0AAW1JGP3_POPJA
MRVMRVCRVWTEEGIGTRRRPTGQPRRTNGLEEQAALLLCVYDIAAFEPLDFFIPSTISASYDCGPLSPTLELVQRTAALGSKMA